MAFNLLDALSGTIGTQLTNHASKLFGESASGIQSAVGAILPAIIGGVVKQGSTATGARVEYTAGWKVQRRDIVMTIARWGLGLVTLVGAVFPAAAVPVAILDSTILNAPRVQIFSPPTPPPISIDRAFSDATGSYHAVMQDGPNQIALKGFMQSSSSSASAELINIIDDQLTFQNLPAPTVITFHLIVDGTGLLPTTVFNNQTFFGAAQLILSNAFGGGPPAGVTDNPGININYLATPCGTPFPLCLQEPADTPFSIDFDFTETRLMTNNMPLDFALEMQLFGLHGAELDFLDTARLVFDLPPGASVTSIGGFSAVGAQASEPPSILLLGSATLLLVFAVRRRLR